MRLRNRGGWWQAGKVHNQWSRQRLRRRATRGWKKRRDTEAPDRSGGSSVSPTEADDNWDERPTGEVIESPGPTGTSQGWGGESRVVLKLFWQWPRRKGRQSTHAIPVFQLRHLWHEPLSFDFSSSLLTCTHTRTQTGQYTLVINHPFIFCCEYFVSRTYVHCSLLYLNK